MSDRKMLLPARLICEFLQSNPAATRARIAEGLGKQYTTVKKSLERLVKSGYVSRTGEYDATFSLTGKPFPASADYQKSPKYVATAARSARTYLRRTHLDEAIYNMVLNARAA